MLVGCCERHRASGTGLSVQLSRAEPSALRRVARATRLKNILSSGGCWESSGLFSGCGPASSHSRDWLVAGMGGCEPAKLTSALGGRSTRMSESTWSSTCTVTLLSFPCYVQATPTDYSETPAWVLHEQAAPPQPVRRTSSTRSSTIARAGA